MRARLMYGFIAPCPGCATELALKHGVGAERINSYGPGYTPDSGLAIFYTRKFTIRKDSIVRVGQTISTGPNDLPKLLSVAKELKEDVRLCDIGWYMQS